MKNTLTLIAVILATAGTTVAGTIADAKSAGDSAIVDIDAAIVINVNDGVNSTSSASMHIRDNTGAITLYGSQSAMATFAAAYPVGSWISLSDVEVDVYANLYELKASNWSTGFSGDVSTATPIAGVNADPIAIDITDMDNYQSELVVIDNVTFDEIGNFAYGNGDFHDDVASGLYRVPRSDAAIVGDPIPTDSGLVVTGIVSTYYSDDQLFLWNSDQIVPEPATMSLLALGGLVAIRRRK